MIENIIDINAFEMCGTSKTPNLCDCFVCYGINKVHGQQQCYLMGILDLDLIANALKSRHVDPRLITHFVIVTLLEANTCLKSTHKTPKKFTIIFILGISHGIVQVE